MLIYPLKIVIFHSFLCLPEGIVDLPMKNDGFSQKKHCDFP